MPLGTLDIDMYPVDFFRKKKLDLSINLRNATQSSRKNRNVISVCW